jgi:hypothetical protein
MHGLFLSDSTLNETQVFASYFVIYRIAWRIHVMVHPHTKDIGVVVWDATNSVKSIQAKAFFIVY